MIAPSHSFIRACWLFVSVAFITGLLVERRAAILRVHTYFPIPVFFLSVIMRRRSRLAPGRLRTKVRLPFLIHL
jgi:hypothetical protein